MICTEDLSVKNMVKNRSLSKSISDAGWSSLVSMISYKSSWYGRTFHKIDRWEPTSKTCSCCGVKAEAMDLSIREWVCNSCGTSHDRDINAARNILNTGLSDASGQFFSTFLGFPLYALPEKPMGKSYNLFFCYTNLDELKHFSLERGT